MARRPNPPPCPCAPTLGGDGACEGERPGGDDAAGGEAPLPVSGKKTYVPTDTEADGKDLADHPGAVGGMMANRKVVG